MLNRIIGYSLNIIGIVFLGVILWNFTHKPLTSTPQAIKQVRIGSTMRLSGISWADAPHTVVMAVSTTCPYCRASATFYKALVSNSAPRKFRVVAVLPEPLDVAKRSLPALGITGLADIQQVNYEALGLSATPELIVINQQGRVEAAWIGRLNKVQEAEVFAKLGVTRFVAKGTEVSDVTAHESEFVAPQQVHALLEDPTTVLVDTRARIGFQQAHIVGALNIPLDELYSRAVHELSPQKSLLIFCHALHSQEFGGCPVRGEADNEIASFCRSTKEMLEHAGFGNVHLIAADLPLLEKQGVTIAGTTCK